MAQELTDRQKQVHDLIEAGKKPPEIAKKLGISTNAVYQQIRRMRGASKSGRKSGSRRVRATPRPTPPAPRPAAEVRPTAVTPLQSIRARRSEIDAEVKAARAGTQDAEKAAEKAREALAKTLERHKDEIKRLDGAEAALTGKPKAAAPRKRPSRAKGASAPQSTNGTAAAAETGAASPAAGAKAA